MKDGASINAIGPFIFPSPDDPRWSEEKTFIPGMIFYRLATVEIVFLEDFEASSLYVNGTRLKEVEGLPRDWKVRERCYGSAVALAYRTAHPRADLRPILRDKMLADLESVSAEAGGTDKAT